MIIDSRNEFCDAISVAATAGTTLIGNVIDLGTDGINDVDGLYFVMNVDTEVITAGAAGTIQYTLASDAQAAIATDGSATVHAISPSIVTDDTAANGALCKAGATVMAIELPKGQYERYLGVLCTVGTTTTTAGKVNAFLTPVPVTQKAFPDAL